MRIIIILYKFFVVFVSFATINYGRETDATPTVNLQRGGQVGRASTS